MILVTILLRFVFQSYCDNISFQILSCVSSWRFASVDAPGAQSPGLLFGFCRASVGVLQPIRGFGLRLGFSSAFGVSIKGIDMA